MTTSSQAPSAAFQSCVDEVVRQSPFLIDRWCSSLVNAMLERSLVTPDPLHRHKIQNAIVVLKKNRLSIEHGFPQELKKAIAAEGAQAGNARKAVQAGRSLSSVSFDELELMGDNEVEQAVESARLQQLVKLACEAGLAAFAARLSTAQGFLVVKAHTNPLRPEVVASALLRLLQSLPVTGDTRACWLVDGARILGEELQSLYVRLNELLAAQGIAPAVYGVSATPEARAVRVPAREPGPAAQGWPNAAFEQNNSGYRPAADPDPGRASRRPLLTLDHLHRLLVGDYESAASDDAPSFSEFGQEQLVHQDFSHTVPAALDVLTELEEKGLVSTRMKLTRRAPSPPVAQLRAQLKTDAKTLGQSLAIEVVGLMIEQMANDERLLMPVRQVIAAAEPAFLGLAVTDPRFFSDKTHPARRLLDAMATTSLGYASESAPGFAEFIHNLHQVAALLGQGEAGDAQHFAELLHDFESRQQRNTPQTRQAQRLAVQALLQAEQRNLMAVKIAADIRARPDFSDRNRIITAFLTGPWAQVMAQERLARPPGIFGASAAVFGLTLDDVLWSLDRAQVAGQRKRLVGLIPGMLQSLRRGLATIDFPPEQSRAFFDELMTAHEGALKAWPEAAPAPAQDGHALQGMFTQGEGGEAAPLWLAPSEVQHSGFMEDWDVPSLVDSSPQLLAPPGQGESIELDLGDWVDLMVDMQWLRAQLTWVSPESTLFMFTSPGGRKHSMTSRVLRHLLKLNLVKVVSQQGVVQGALDGVARTAMHNSVQSKDGDS